LCSNCWVIDFVNVAVETREIDTGHVGILPTVYGTKHIELNTAHDYF